MPMGILVSSVLVPSRDRDLEIGKKKDTLFDTGERRCPRGFNNFTKVLSRCMAEIRECLF